MAMANWRCPKTSRKPESIPPAAYLVLLHKEAIQEAKEAITSTTREKDYKADSPHYAGIIKAEKNQLVELEDQLRNYKAVMARTTDYDVAMRESHRFSGRLPILAKRDTIDRCIETFDSENRFLIVHGETGSGKSTQLPLYIADHPRMSGKKVISTQPRKIAAVCLADRVSYDYACGLDHEVGKEVGYSIDGPESRTSETTKIEFVTEERMLERVINMRKEDFKNVGAIILDEAHERSIICDILLGMLKKCVPLWSDILIVIASATINLEAFVKFFDNRVNIIKIPGRMYPVTRIYRPLFKVDAKDVHSLEVRENEDIIKAVATTALEIHDSSGTDKGNILCFLPGDQEAHLAAIYFQNHINSKKDGKKLLQPKIYELSGRQEVDEQRAVFEELDPKIYRKIIFASPIAETSITINGVVYVVDSGYKKETIFDPQRNISALKTVLISQSSSLQREGRAGRTQPGVCYKLYSEEDFENMSINHSPEILRRPLPLAIIYLRRMGIDPAAFDWISAPLPETIKSAEEELIILGALDEVHKQSTDLGNLISYSQQEPKIVRMIYTGMLKGLGKAAIKIAALLSVSKLFFCSGGKDADKETKNKLADTRLPLLDKRGDILTLFKLYDEFKLLADNQDGVDKGAKDLKKIQSEWVDNEALSRRAIRVANTTMRDLEYTFSNTELWKENGDQNLAPDDESVLRLFCSGFFLHAARRVNVKGNPHRYHYFALQTEIVGSLPSEANLSQTANEEMADWIVFDEILKYPEVTMFLTSSKIELEWIQDESKPFYEICILEQSNLPTEIVEVRESDTILSRVLGSSLVNLPAIEQRLGCSLDADLSTGSLRALCCKPAVEFVENSLQVEVKNVKENIESETIEHPWLGNIRLVIGLGYKIISILFAGEFDTFFLYNLGKNWTQGILKTFVNSKIGDPDKIVNVQVNYKDYQSVAMIKLKNPSDAVQFMKKIKHDFQENNVDVRVTSQLDNIGASVGVAEKSSISPGFVPRAVNVRLKISWPLGRSTGKVIIFLKSAEDGNKVIDLLPYFGVIASAVGYTYTASMNESDRGSKPLIQKICGHWKFLRHHPYDVQPEFKVQGEHLPEEKDEFDIFKLLNANSIKPLKVVLERLRCSSWNRPPRFSDKQKRPSKTPEEMKKKKLDLCTKMFGVQKGVKTTEILEFAANRAGIYVQYPDGIDVEKAFVQLRHEYSEIKEFGQPCRVELEKIYSFSIHENLHECLYAKFDEAIREIRKLKVWVTVTNPKSDDKEDETSNKSSFLYINYGHTDVEILQHCQQMLESVVERDSIGPKSSPKIANLFSSTGSLLIREKIPTPSKDYYLHWNNQNFEVYVYGMDPAKRKEVIDKLINIIEQIDKWKEANLFEVWISLDRRELEKLQEETPEYVDLICQEFKLAKGQYRLVGKSKLVVSMDSNEEFEKFKSYLEEKGLLATDRKNNLALNYDCGLCFCEVEPKFMITSLCNHAFCMECIRNMFNGIREGAGVQQLPLCCPADKCEQLLPIEDIKKIVPDEAISKLDETVLNIYLRTPEGANFRYCPKPGCNRIFKRLKGRKGEPTFYNCDCCLNSFCLDCTEFLQKEIPAHLGMGCEAFRTREDDILRKLMNQIREEILTLRCPRCKTTFLDYDGCAALTCSSSSCKAGFCALCLEDCGADAHSHVANCPYNVAKTVYVDKREVNKANREIRVEKLNSFFRELLKSKELPILNFKTKLRNGLLVDLSDLGIEFSEIKIFEGTAEGSCEDDTVQNLVNQVRNEILTLQCPSCNAPYFDCEGYAVFTCNSCFVPFCTLCQERFNEEIYAYRHIKKCPLNEARNLIVSELVFDNANRINRIDKLKTFFKNISELQQPDLKLKVLSELRQDFRDLKLRTKDFDCD